MHSIFRNQRRNNAKIELHKLFTWFNFSREKWTRGTFSAVVVCEIKHATSFIFNGLFVPNSS